MTGSISILQLDIHSLDAAVAAWSQYLAVEKGLSPRTVSAYVGDALRFAKWLHSALEAPVPLDSALRLPVMRAYVRHLGTVRSCGSATIARAVAALKSLSSWAAREEAIPADVAADLDRPKVVTSVPRFLDGDALSALVAWTVKHGSTPTSQPRDHALVVLFAYSGARLSEVRNFRVVDLDIANATIRLHGKGRKDRLLPIAAPAVAILRHWILHRRSRRSPWLFPGAAEGRLHARTIQRVIGRVSLAALGRSVSPHTLRHSYATFLHRSGVSLRDLQLLLGHASIATTQVYLHTSPRDLDYVRAFDLGGLSS